MQYFMFFYHVFFISAFQLRQYKNFPMSHTSFQTDLSFYSFFTRNLTRKKLFTLFISPIKYFLNMIFTEWF